MMVYDEHGVPVFDSTGMPHSKAKAKHMAGGQDLLSGHLTSRVPIRIL